MDVEAIPCGRFTRKFVSLLRKISRGFFEKKFSAKFSYLDIIVLKGNLVVKSFAAFGEGSRSHTP
jgi:hypothetical protein